MSSTAAASAGSSGAVPFRMNHTMYRIRDPAVSLPFYTEQCGMSVLWRMDVPSLKFTNYFLGYNAPADISSWSDADKQKFVFQQSGVIELCHNWGTEEKDESPYHNGNKEPQGFGHICLVVDDVKAATQRFKDRGVKIVKEPDSGSLKGIAFIADPDNYWIELVPALGGLELK
ncbi:hypothetical protein CXG81DRAFT_26754 [Caulochytrium protostelioides]|uniref:Aldoketomutase n=1 Tax=Caulochytrium protostelioides TaxID=1555241 RepID=A0A4P9X5U8_9FUNG|nr:glyoxalase I [Caulochytrium protostelioides]RKP00525.1 hypothetical protein CXG81DRAFT_26754 [Caulochytrium protostelioides]|eukprot:RKP00525.1 hypothetical protein CXG81DRAFT_26754 [Caulochytrium protostelioides]